MADGLDDIRRDIVTLSTKEKAIIARDVLPSLDRENRNNIVSEFTDSPEVREDRLREAQEARLEEQTTRRLYIGIFVFFLTLILLGVIVLLAPEHLEVLLPVMTSILGTVVGFLFGQQGSRHPS